MTASVLALGCLVAFWIALIEGTEEKNNIFVYNDYGSRQENVNVLLAALRRDTTSRYNVTTISASEVIQGTWRQTAAAYVMGSGFDLGFIRSLGDEGARQIRDYVEAGGSYLGFGAGSYYACNYIEFDKDGPQEVIGLRPLRFFPGKCSGPVTGTYDYHSNSGASAARIQFFRYTNTSANDPMTITNMRVFCNGGNKFVPYSPTPVHSIVDGCVVRTIAVYADDPGHYPAIVKCNVGQGTAILSGVKMEYRLQDMDRDDPYLQPIIEDIRSNMEDIEKGLCYMFYQLGLEVRCTL